MNSIQGAYWGITFSYSNHTYCAENSVSYSYNISIFIIDDLGDDGNGNAEPKPEDDFTNIIIIIRIIIARAVLKKR